MIVSTSICANYIPKAKVLATSLKHHNPDVFFVLCLIERTIHLAACDPIFDAVITARELGIKNFESFMFKYFLVEASTAVKGYLFKELLRRYPREDEFVCLDPDILVTGPFVELSEIIKAHNIILTPHLCKPEESEDLEAIMDNEICSLQHGVFNLGFLAIKRSEESRRFVDWWTSRLHKFCYADIPRGLWTDQRWIDLAPCFFNVFIFKHPGYNVAPWNLSQRHITQNDKGELFVNGYPLRFFHFTGFDSGANEAMIRKYCPNKNSPVYGLRDQYIELCNRYGQTELERIPWSYNFYSNGKKIKRDHRIAYRTNMKLREKFKGPFNVEASPSFYKLSKLSLVFKIYKTYLEKRILLRRAKDAFEKGGVRLVMKKALEYAKRKYA